VNLTQITEFTSEAVKPQQYRDWDLSLCKIIAWLNSWPHTRPDCQELTERWSAWSVT